jgi:fructose-1,6-bisphosphatase-3
VRDGVDIIPSISEVRRWNPLRKVAQTESGENIRTRIKTLKKLIVAYRKNLLQQGRYS